MNQTHFVSFLLIVGLITTNLGCSKKGGKKPDLRATCLTESIVDCKSTSCPTEEMTRCCVPGDDNQYTQLKPEVKENPTLCQACNPLSCALDLGAENTALIAGEGAQAANAQAAALAGIAAAPVASKDGSPEVLDPAKNSLASTAATKPTNGSPSNQRAGGLQNPTSAGAFLPKGGAGGNSAAPSSNGTGASAGGDDAPSSGLNGKVSQLMAAIQAVTGDSGSTYSGGGKPGTSRSSQGLGDRGQTSIEGGESSGELKKYGKNGSPQSDLIPVEDPAEYFTLIGTEADLFKIIHEKYSNQSAAWVREDLKRKSR